LKFRPIWHTRSCHLFNGLRPGGASDRFDHLLIDPADRLETLSNEMSTLLRLFGRFLRIVPGYREQVRLARSWI
jgi:hypothetical protein